MRKVIKHPNGMTEVDCTHLVPKQEIVENTLALYQWEVTEDIQDHSPYIEWGWYGFVPMIIQRN